VVHPKNNAQSLSSTQLQDIYSGKISNWNEVGGVDREINLYTRDEASGTRNVFWKKALAKGDISARANVVVSNGAMKTAVAGDPFAIGFVSVGNMDSSVAPVTLDGVTPNLVSVRSGEYKVARGLYSLTKGEPSGFAKLFLEFIISPTGQKIVADKGLFRFNEILDLFGQRIPISDSGSFQRTTRCRYFFVSSYFSGCRCCSPANWQTCCFLPGHRTKVCTGFIPC